MRSSERCDGQLHHPSKFFLHITPQEQEKRLLAREKEPADAGSLASTIGRIARSGTSSPKRTRTRSAAALPRTLLDRGSGECEWYRDLFIGEALVAAMGRIAKLGGRRWTRRARSSGADLKEWRAKHS